MELTPEQQILFNLLKLSLWPGQNKEDLLSGFVQVKWEEVISFASRQGVIAVSYDGLNSTELLAAVPRMQKIGWELSVGFLEAREKRQREVIRELVSIFYKNGIELLLLKGIGLGENYPLPSHRECGDIDIYLYNDYEKGNQLIKNLGIKVDKEGTKHAEFIFKGVHVENHKTFLDVTSGKVNRKIENHLHRILEEQGFETIRIDETMVRIPTPDFTAVFLTRHNINHFVTSGLMLRNLCDFALFFNRNTTSINFSQFLKILEENSQLDIFSAFMYLIQKHLGISIDAFSALPQNENLSDRVRHDMIYNSFRRIGTEEREKWGFFRRKTMGAAHLLQSKWKYNLTGEAFLFFHHLRLLLQAALSREY